MTSKIKVLNLSQIVFALLIFTSFILTTTSAKAEESVPSIKVSNSAEDLTEAFQREYTYLASQKSALSEQKKNLEKNLNQKIAAVKQQITKAQKEVVWLSAENDDSHEYLMTLDKRKKDLQKRESSLESVYKKAHTSLTEFKNGLYFDSESGKTASIKNDQIVPEDLKLQDFESLVKESKEILQTSHQTEDFPSSFLNAEDKLVDGTVTRIGQSAAIGFSKGEYFVLGPDGKGMLKALQKTDKPESLHSSVYVFDSLNEIAEVKKIGGFTEKLADLSPILFLGMMLMMVLGLFMAMIRV